MIRYAAIALVALALAGCDVRDQEPVKNDKNTQYYDNGEVGGCHLYSVRPLYGDNFQLAVCPGAKAMTEQRRGCGKGCSRGDRVETDGGAL